MSGTYLVWLADVLRSAGLSVVEYDNWQTRARSSGGYASGRPVCVMWHHTASATTPANDAAYMCETSDSRPIANLLVARDGAVWVLAAGATNTNGKGRSMTFSRGTVPADSMNTWAVGMEIANGGNDDPFPAVQIDACFDASNAINAHLGNLATDVAGHVDYAPDRKIDPNNCASVQGPWQPGSNGTSAASWRLDDLRAECDRRAQQEETEVITEDDVERIAAAVWRQTMLFRPTNKQMDAQDLLETTAHYACNADMQTRE